MKVELRKNGGPKITADREGLHALRELLGAALEVGHGFQSDGTLPEVVVVDDRGKVMLPARPEKKVSIEDFEKHLAGRAEAERELRQSLGIDLDPDHVANLKQLYGDPEKLAQDLKAATAGQRAETEAEFRRRHGVRQTSLGEIPELKKRGEGIEAERLDSGQE
jgi:hypothetical protein